LPEPLVPNGLGHGGDREPLGQAERQHLVADGHELGQRLDRFVPVDGSGACLDDRRHHNLPQIS
jgi:hypothetical protein